jgi:hypothetical protein
MAHGQPLLPTHRVAGIPTDEASKRRQELRITSLEREVTALKAQMQQWTMLVDGKIADLMSKIAASQDDRMPDLMARVARLETNRGPGRPPNQR